MSFTASHRIHILAGRRIRHILNPSKYRSNKHIQFLLAVISVLVAIDFFHEYWAVAGQAEIYLSVIGVSVLLAVIFAVLASTSDNNSESA